MNLTSRSGIRICLSGLILFHLFLAAIIMQIKSSSQTETFLSLVEKNRVHIKDIRSFENSERSYYKIHLGDNYQVEGVIIKAMVKTNKSESILDQLRHINLVQPTPAKRSTFYNKTTTFDCDDGFVDKFHQSARTAKHSFHWQTVEFTDRPNAYVYSAYYDARSRPGAVVIISLSTGGRSVPEFCRLWFRGEGQGKEISIITRAWLRYVPDISNKRYAAAFYTCYAPNGRIPEVVALVTERCQTPTNLLKIIQSSPPDFTPEHLRASQELGKENGAGRNDIKTATERDATTTSKPVVNFTVCVTPFNLHYNDVHQLVEMIETNRMFGAERFVFYNHSTGPDVEQYLKSYISDGIVEVIPWHIPVIVDQWPPPNPPVQPEIHYFGQLAALNDCLYRSSGSTRFIVFTDMDEILVPRAQKSWIELLDSVNGKWAERNSNRSGVKIPGAYIVRNTFFRHDWGNDNKMASDKLVSRLRLRTLLTTTRESDIQPWYSRSKHIVWARMIQMVGVHNIIRFIDDRKVEPLLVQTTDALIHHYRPSMWPDDPASPMGRIRDRRMHAFQDDIISRTQARHRKVERLRQIRT